MAVERVIVDDRTAFLRRPDHRTVRVLALAGLVVLWELITRTGLVSSLFLPSPIGVLAEGWDMAVSGQLHVHLLTSLERLAWGFAIGALAGISVGVAGPGDFVGLREGDGVVEAGHKTMIAWDLMSQFATSRARTDAEKRS